MGSLDGIQKYHPTEVDLGNVPGYRPGSSYGFSKSIGASSETVWYDNSEVSFRDPSDGATSMYLYSDSSEDATDGTGLIKVTVTYLQLDYTQVTVNKTMAGNTWVLIATDAFRVNAISPELFGEGIIVGSNKKNVGTIYAGYGGTVDTVPDNIAMIMPPEKNTTAATVYTVPKGQKWAFESNLASSAGSKEAFLDFWVHFGGVQIPIWVGGFTVMQSAFLVGPNLRGFGYLPAGTDGWVNAKRAEGGGGTVEITFLTTFTVQDV